MTVKLPAKSGSIAADTAARATFSTGTGARSAMASTGMFRSSVEMGDIAIQRGSGSAARPTYLVPDTPPGLSTTAPAPELGSVNSSLAYASACALPTAYPAEKTPLARDTPKDMPGTKGGMDAPTTTRRGTPAACAARAGATLVSPLSRTTSSYVSDGRGRRPTAVITASAPTSLSRYVSGSSALPGCHSTLSLQACAAIRAGGRPPRVRHVTDSPRRTASSAMADPTNPVPPNTTRRTSRFGASLPRAAIALAEEGMGE
mmetsp:Transcript_2337/g.5606  ORF Transcript_2337/g.5606 Transcript_2337/m.5606 type:complete len:260 (+) Transcript_2337:334-1113(+)